MSNFSRNTFDPNKQYVGVRLQQGVPLVDADWNEFEDIRRAELENLVKNFVGDGVAQGSDAFLIQTITNIHTDFQIGAGFCLVSGFIVNNPAILNYTSQADIPDLTLPPDNTNRTDLVYLDIWEREVDALEDSNLVNNAIGIETCVRQKREWRVRVAEGVQLPPPDPGHYFYLLAQLQRGNRDNIQSTVVIEQRTIANPALANATPTDGLQLKHHLVAQENNDILTAVEIDPSFDDKSFTGVQHYGLVVKKGSVALGEGTVASGRTSIAMGIGTTASGNSSTALGHNTTASNTVSTALGNSTIASGDSSTAIGVSTIASGGYSTAMGLSTTASGERSTAMGYQTTASNYYSTALGYQTTASGYYSTAMGNRTIASGYVSTALGQNTTASGDSSTALGLSTSASGDRSTAIGQSTTASGSVSTTMGYQTISSGYASTAMGYSTTASNNYSTAMGYSTTASGDTATALGYSTTASGYISTAMGRETKAEGSYSTALGRSTTASGYASTALGYSTTASGYISTAMGRETKAEGNYSTALGYRAVVQEGHNFTFVYSDGNYYLDGRTWDYHDFSSTNARQFLIHAANGVGINTDNPSTYALYVNGNTYINGQLNGHTADYAEYFESLSGKEIPVGTAVSLDSGKIRPAKSGEIPIGIISANPMVVGGVYTEWPKKYLQDELGASLVDQHQQPEMIPKKILVTKERQQTLKKTITEAVTRTEAVLENGRYCQKTITENQTKEIDEPQFNEFDLYDDKGENLIGKHRVPLMETYQVEEEARDEQGQPVWVSSGRSTTVKIPKLNPNYDATQTYIPRQDRPEWNCVGLLGQLPLLKGQPVAPTWVKIREMTTEVELWLVK